MSILEGEGKSHVCHIELPKKLKKKMLYKNKTIDKYGIMKKNQKIALRKQPHSQKHQQEENI